MSLPPFPRVHVGHGNHRSHAGKKIHGTSEIDRQTDRQTDRQIDR